MTKSIQHVSTHVGRPADVVYAYAADPRHLPEWAAGLGSTVELVDGAWVADSPMGRVTVCFAPDNAFGVLDHDVTLPDGTETTNPVRVLADGDECDVVFTLRQRDDVTDEAFAADVAAVTADLHTLRQVLER